MLHTHCHRWLATLPLALSCASFTASVLHAQTVTWSAAVSHSSGRYQFDEAFQSWTLMNTLTIGGGAARLSFTLPVVAQDGRVVSRVGGTTIPTGGPDAGAVRRRSADRPIGTRPGRRGHQTNLSALSGAVAEDSLTVTGAGATEFRVADPLLSAMFDLYEGRGLLRLIGVNASAKPPFASVSSGVGTGAWDAGAGLTMVLGTEGTMLFADAAWWHLGDLPDLPLRDAVFGSVGLGQAFGSRWNLLATVSGASRVIASSEPPWSSTLTITRFLPSDGSASLSVGTGLTETAADLFVAVGWRVALSR